MLVLLAIVAAVPPTASAEPRPTTPGAGMLGFDLDASTIPDLQRKMHAGELTAFQLTTAYLRRIHTVDRKLHAVLSTDPGALRAAYASDRRRYTGALRGPLDGIPVLLKDNVDTHTVDTRDAGNRRGSTAGSRALLGSRTAGDATLVRKLRAAGAVILGSTNLSEWANFRSSASTSGWSGVGLQTNNPYVLDRNPCGSSSGSGVAVAASLSQVAIGTETDGSIVCPAGQNGVVGHKPSLGLVSRTGVAPISAEQDTPGPMARHVIDAAIVMSALQGRDQSDDATAEYPQTQPADYPRALRPHVLRGARIGMWRLSGVDAGVDRVVRATERRLRAAGATVVDVELPYQNEISAAEMPALLAEFARDLPDYLARRPGGPDTIAELVRFNRRDPVELSRFGQELFEQALNAPGTDTPEYRALRTTATSLARRSIDETVTEHRLDAIVAPTNGPAWVTTYGDGDALELGSSTPAAVAGYPATVVPAGYVGELPIGVTFFGGRWADATTLGLAASFEKAAPVRRAPRHLPSVD